VGDAGRHAAVVPVAVAAVLGGVHGQDGLVPAAFLDPGDGVGGEPVVAVDDVEAAGAVLHREGGVGEGATHVIELIHKIRVQRERAAVVVDAVDAVVTGLVVPLAGEDVDLVAAAFEAGGQLGDVNADAADGEGVKAFPRKQGNPHGYVLRLLHRA